MARGWESKAVESQMEAAEDRAGRSSQPRLTPEQINLQRVRESLELSRIRVLQDLATATHARYRDQLRESLAFLDAKIAALDTSSSERHSRE
jgi:hypothetical protein